MARLTDPVTILKGVGPTKAKQFANLNIYTLGDLICHFPRGYEDRTKLIPIEKLEVDIPACFRAMVMNTPRTTHIRKGLDLTKVQVADHTARLNLTFLIISMWRSSCSTAGSIFSTVRSAAISSATI